MCLQYAKLHWTKNASYLVALEIGTSTRKYKWKTTRTLCSTYKIYLNHFNYCIFGKCENGRNVKLLLHSRCGLCNENTAALSHHDDDHQIFSCMKLSEKLKLEPKIVPVHQFHLHTKYKFMTNIYLRAFMHFYLYILKMFGQSAIKELAMGFICNH